MRYFTVYAGICNSVWPPSDKDIRETSGWEERDRVLEFQCVNVYDSIGREFFVGGETKGVEG